jgi:hypothetical protein
MDYFSKLLYYIYQAAKSGRGAQNCCHTISKGIHLEFFKSKYIQIYGIMNRVNEGLHKTL